MKYGGLVSYREWFEAITEADDQGPNVISSVQMSLLYLPAQVDEGGEEKIYLCLCSMKALWDKRPITVRVGNRENRIKATAPTEETNILCGKSKNIFKNQYPFCKWEPTEVEKAKPGNILKNLRLPWPGSPVG